MGSAIKDWLKASGVGVRNAAATKANTIAVEAVNENTETKLTAEDYSPWKSMAFVNSELVESGVTVITKDSASLVTFFSDTASSS